MTRVSAVLVGASLISSLWLGVLATVFTPQRPAGGLVHALCRCILTSRGMTGRMSPRLALLTCRIRAGLVLATVVSSWLVLDLLGFLFLARAFGRLPLTPTGVVDFLTGRAGDAPLVLLTWASLGLLVTAAAAYLAQFASAYRNREVLLIRLSGENLGAPDAEVMLSRLLHGSSRDDLGEAFREWENWLVEVDYNHTVHPALLLMPAASMMSWGEAAVMMLDSAALVEATAPEWAPANAKNLINVGIRALQGTAGKLRVMPLPAGVSLHGREERGFTDTLDLISCSGVRIERDPQTAWVSFQGARTQYAPHAAALHNCLDAGVRPGRRIDG